MSWFMDLSLARRLERTEGAVGASFPVVSQQLRPEVGAAWHDFAGTYAIFDGADSPLSQTFGLGLFGESLADGPAGLAAIEAFFEQRGAPVMHEVSPLAGVETYARLAERGYLPIELSTVLAQGIADAAAAPAPASAPTAPGLRVRIIEPADRGAWIETSVAGWSEDPAFAGIMRSMAEVASANQAMLHFVVEHDGAPIATGSLGMHEGVALLAGASTIPAARGLGAQALLLAERLAEARRRGCEIAMMVTAPGSTSQRNAERRGFRVAYTRTKWRLARG
jgi:GNAT superfamily N-acetyltransferase